MPIDATATATAASVAGTTTASPRMSERHQDLIDLFVGLALTDKMYARHAHGACAIFAV
jgi:hypothetical protein